MVCSLRSLLALGLPCVLGLLLVSPAGAASFWVGNGGVAPCTHSNLQDALSSAAGTVETDTIRIVGTGTLTGPFSLLGSGVTVVGGAPSCGSTASTGYTTLTAASGSRVLSILTGEAGTITLRRLKLTTNLGSFNGNGGALWFAGVANSLLALEDSQVFSSIATGEGGGIFANGGGLTLASGSLVFDNRANLGGGIAVSGGNSLLVANGSVVSANTAFTAGGGVYVLAGRVAAFGSASAGPAYFVNNLAGGRGGGIFVEPAGRVDFAFANPPTVVSGNQAGDGGGLWVGTTIAGASQASNLTTVVIEGNLASGSGGGVYFGEDAFVISGPEGRLPRFQDNTAGQGSAMFLDRATINFYGGEFRNHTAGAGGAAVIAQEGFGLAFLSGLVFHHNTGPELFSLSGGAALTLQFSSIAANTLTGLVRDAQAGPGITLSYVAVDETEPLYSAIGANSQPPTTTCSMSRHGSFFVGWPAGSQFAEWNQGDPGFADPASGDFHLRVNAPAIDRCAYSGTALADFDGDDRGYDDPYSAFLPTHLHDVGADEVQVLFRNGFENGTTLAWDVVMP